MTRACLGLGANLGDPATQLSRAAAELVRTPGVILLGASSLYVTAPWGDGPDQPDFFNAVLVVETDLTPRALLDRGHELERAAGRVRDGGRNQPRRLDIDLLLYGDEAVREPGLEVPHPRLAERAFALVPLAEAAPDARHPVLRRTAAELAARVASADVRKLPGGDSWLARK